MVAIEDGRYHYAAGQAVEPPRVSTNLPFIMGSLVMLLIVGLVGFADEMTKSADIVTRAAVAVEAGFDKKLKPYIYQFDVVSQGGGEGRRKIPYVWNQVWDAAGWTPHKLAIERSAADPRYHEVIQRIAKVSVAQRRIVYKYLAMAASGGGWLAHSDTFPLHTFGSDLTLPNNGRLTAYGGPCLMSGNASEWLRVGKVVAEHAHVAAYKNEQNTWSEDLALYWIKNHYTNVENQIFEVPKLENELQWAWDPEHCHLTKNARAVHFRLGENEEFATLRDPGDMVVKWLSMWLQHCERSDVFIGVERRAEEEVNKTIIQAGSFHAPEDYNATRQNEEHQTQANDAPVQETVVASQNPVVQAGSFHVGADGDHRGLRSLPLEAGV